MEEIGEQNLNGLPNTSLKYIYGIEHWVSARKKKPCFSHMTHLYLLHVIEMRTLSNYIYVALMRILYIDKVHPKSTALNGYTI